MTTAMKTIEHLGRLPLAARRIALRTAWRASLPFRRDVGFGLEPFFEKRLRVGTEEARRLAREHDFHDLLLIMEWFASIRRSQAEMLADTRNTTVSDPDLPARLAATGDVVILAPLHMGVFPLGISHVLWHWFRGRRLLVLRAREDLEENNIAMDRLREIAGEFRILNTRDEADFVDAMRFARKGAVVVSLLDLPETYGSPAETRLFEETASIAMGLDAMARMLKGVVLPMTVCSRLTRDEIVFGRPFEVARTTADDRSELAMTIGRQIESFVKLAPEQWHMWTRLGEFYPAGWSSGGSEGFRTLAQKVAAHAAG